MSFPARPAILAHQPHRVHVKQQMHMVRHHLYAQHRVSVLFLLVRVSVLFLLVVDELPEEIEVACSG